jgi:DNA adenine methylase
MRDVQISCRNAITVIDQRDSLDTFFYIDPPYPNSDQGHYRGFKVINLLELCEKLNKITGKFILSNYAIPELIEFLIIHKWNVLQYDMRLLSTPKRIARKTELLITNFDIINTLF